ncbi:PLP-dependent aminotransferase family protein [Phytoactinopolyspora limicola]|uniref:aminotransferase-like domain-containing protein n=1 Tax=Phytoactinopolyspora limicola TaxID=2715536 RepID=UPI0014098703|nr:PLP-dependent aminotransferase family protein [Phytoactinopolyspora limicola]
MQSDSAIRLATICGDAPAAGKGEWLRAQLIAAIHGGKLGAGDTLPGARDLAGALGVSRGTTDAVYAQLAAEGFVRLAPRRRPIVTGVVGSGPRVPERPTSAAPPRSPSVPDPALFPHRAWSAASRMAMSQLAGTDLGYPDPAGHPRLRLVLADWLRRTRGVSVAPDSVHVTGGVAHAMALLAQVLGAAQWAVEKPGSPGSTQMMEELVDVRRVPIDESGLVPEDIPPGVGAVLVTPTRQYPTGLLMPAGRRRALVDACTEAGRWLVEDDWDSHLAAPATPGAIQALAPETVVLMGSLSKVLAPGLRLGWIVAPHAVAVRLRQLRERTDLGVSVFVQLTAAELISSGALDRHIRRARGIYQRRWDRLAAHLGDLGELRGTPGGVHAFVRTHAPRVLIAEMTRVGVPAVEVVDERFPGVVVSVASYTR